MSNVGFWNNKTFNTACAIEHLIVKLFLLIPSQWVMMGIPMLLSEWSAPSTLKHWGAEAGRHTHIIASPRSSCLTFPNDPDLGSATVS